MSDNTPESEAEELLQQSKDQKRHTSDPTDSGLPDTEVDRVEAIKEALLSIESGNTPENINIRDRRLKGLLVGLEVAGELDTIAEDLVATLDGDFEIDEATQSDMARLLIRVGLQEALPEVLDDATEARQKALMEQASEF